MAILTPQDIPPQALDLGDIKGIIIAMTMFIGTPLAIAFGRFIWKRADISPSTESEIRVANRRLEQLQHSVDSLAVEVERIQEHQRYVTKALAEKRESDEPLKLR